MGEFRNAHAPVRDLPGPPRHRAAGNQRVHGFSAGSAGRHGGRRRRPAGTTISHFSAAKELALEGHLPGGTNLGFHVIFGVSAITGALTRQEWFHKLMALAFVLLIFLYMALLFAGYSPRISASIA